MTNTAPKNVISMTDYQKSIKPISQNEASNALDDCRDLALARLTGTLAAMLDKMDDDLNDLANSAGDIEEQHAFLGARREAQLKRTAIEATFKKQFMALFREKAISQIMEQPVRDPSASFGLELSLVDDTEIEQNIAISKMATVLQDSCENELQALVTRIGFLLNSPDLDLKANPVSPELIHNTFKAACQQIEVGFTVKLAIMQLFDRYLAKDLPAIYKEINSRLVARQILPEIRPGYRGKPKPGGIAQPAPSQTASQTTATGNGAAEGKEKPQEIFALLQQLLTKSSQPVGQLGMTPSGVSAPSQPAAVTAGFFDSLNRLQHGDDNLLSTLSEGMHAADAFAYETGNLLHEIRNSSLAAGIGQFDAITIDIVAMLFDYIFEDPKIPDAMKTLISRLQIPVLKVAMLDKRFFSSKSHPTRKMLDTLGAAAIGCGDQLIQSDPLYKETERIVQRVLAEFESDVSIFAELLSELETFLASEEKKGEKAIERSAKIIHDRERLEIARIVAEEEVRQRMDGIQTPSMVRHFLQDFWVYVLTNAHGMNGEDSDGWKNALKAMDELLWSVKPKMTAEDRKHLVTRLPGLLKRLHAGMATISMDAADQKRFFTNLVACHTRAVKAGLGSGEPAQPENNPELAWTVADQPDPADNSANTILDAVNEANAESALIRKSLAEGDVQIEEVTMVNEGKAKLSDYQHVQSADSIKSLKRGSWVDFKQPDGSHLRYKLSWVSPLKKVYLFTNISSQKALSISPHAMEIQLREGTAILLEDTPLIDRAVENLLENLQQN